MIAEDRQVTAAQAASERREALVDRVRDVCCRRNGLLSFLVRCHSVESRVVRAMRFLGLIRRFSSSWQ